MGKIQKGNDWIAITSDCGNYTITLFDDYTMYLDNFKFENSLPFEDKNSVEELYSFVKEKFNK